MVRRFIFLLSSFLLFSCTTTGGASVDPVIVSVDSTVAAQPWLTELYSCANRQSVMLNITDRGADINLRVGEPETLLTSAFQIDEEEILIVTHRESPIQNLNLEGVQTLFAGQGDPSMQVWVYASGEDLQMLFDQLVMKGRAVSTSARIAADPQQMSDVLNSEKNAIGILPRHWKAGAVRDVYSVGIVPVLVLQNGEETEITRSLLSCLSR